MKKLLLAIMLYILSSASGWGQVIVTPSLDQPTIQVPSYVKPLTWSDVAVRVENRVGNISEVGSGTIVAGNGQTALVVTVKHMFHSGVGRLTVERTDHHLFEARCLGTSRYADVAALEIADPGIRTLKIATAQAPAATLIGFGGTHRAWKHSGQFVEQTSDGTVFYSFFPIPGDSGGGVFDNSGRLVGVAWGNDGESGAVVPLSDLRRALASPKLEHFWQGGQLTASSRKETR